MNHTASATIFSLGTAVATSTASLFANSITPIEGAIIQLPITIHGNESHNNGAAGNLAGPGNSIIESSLTASVTPPVRRLTGRKRASR